LNQQRLSVRWLLVMVPLFFCVVSNANPTNSLLQQQATSTPRQAIAFLDSIRELPASPYWPNIKPAAFLQNIKANVTTPVSIYPGNGTNFCGYGALSYLFLQDDPLGYAQLLVQLYREGKATFGTVLFDPSDVIKQQAGRLKYKGILDIHPAEQLWFLSLADHFKGYVNIFNRKYDPGDEDTFWASVNYAKFNRMVRNLLHYKANARGADIFRPHVGNLYDYISKKLAAGKVVLYINNRIVHKKKEVKIKLAIPTHFVVLEKIYREADGQITIVYWDYGGKTLRQLSPAFLKRIIFGITSFTKNDSHEN
jgi:hypothetical protein